MLDGRPLSSFPPIRIQAGSRLGKQIARRSLWCRTRHESHQCSDSRNDLPLLLRVDPPHVANPDQVLKAHAEQAGWPIHIWK
jgi:phosphoserine phosphatase